jgi:hypothetical protein
MKRNISGCAAFALAALTANVAVQAHGLAAPNWSKATSVSINTPSGEGCPIETSDGLSLLFASNRLGTFGGNDVWVADRDSLTSPWGMARNLGAPINSSAADFCPTPVFGRSLLFVSERTDNGSGTAPCGGGDIYLSRQSPAGGWSAPVMLKCAPDGPNFPGQERSPSLVQTWYGTFLFYSSTGNGTNHDIYVSRLGADGNFGPGKVVKELSSPDWNEIMPNVRARADGSFEIVFSSDRQTWGHNQAAAGAQDVYYSRSWLLPGLWSTPMNVGDAINTPLVEQRATLSRDGKRLYFGRSDGDIYVSERLSD